MPLPPSPPYINLQNGSITGTIMHGQNFYWYNPTTSDVQVKNCGTWCTQDSYAVPAGGYVQANVSFVTNPNSYAFTEHPNQWNAPGQPHISAPSVPAPQGEEGEKEVA